MSNFYQEAILDAKAVRASAQAVAKAALQEEFGPTVTAAVSKHLAEKTEEELDEKYHSQHTSEEDGMEEAHKEEEGELDEATLDEILAELDAISEEGDGYEEMEEAKKEEELDEAKDKEEESTIPYQNPGSAEALKEAEEEGEEEEEEGEGEEEGGMEGEEPADDTKVIDITLGDLKAVLQSVMAGQQDMGHDDQGSLDGGAEVSLDEILDELSQMDEKKHSEEEMDEAKKKEEEMDEAKKHQEEMDEAKKAIEELRATLHETNLLNAKLLYMNKLFKGKLSESQKAQVLKSLDKAKNVKEAETIYTTLKESFTVRTKSTIKESIGFASQAAGIAPKANIVDADPFVNRWKTLAGIK